MAKKRKKSTGAKRRKRRIGGITGSNTMKAVEVLAYRLVGGIGASVVTNKLLEKSKLDDKIKAGIPLVAGVGLIMFTKPGSMLNHIGEGMSVVGAENTTRQLIPGIGELTEIDISGIEEEITIEGNDEIEGADYVGAIEGAAFIGELNHSGTDDQLD
jgi:hypothetical protein